MSNVCFREWTWCGSILPKIWILTRMIHYCFPPRLQMNLSERCLQPSFSQQSLTSSSQNLRGWPGGWGKMENFWSSAVFLALLMELTCIHNSNVTGSFMMLINLLLMNMSKINCLQNIVWGLWLSEKIFFFHFWFPNNFFLASNTSQMSQIYWSLRSLRGFYGQIRFLKPKSF